MAPPAPPIRTLRQGCAPVAVGCRATRLRKPTSSSAPTLTRRPDGHARPVDRSTARAGVRADDPVHDPPRHFLVEVRPADRPDRSGQPLHRRAVRGRRPRRRGPDRRRGPARRPDRHAHRPLAAGQVHRPRAARARPRSGGARSTGRSREEHYDRLRARLWPTSPIGALYAQDLFIGAAPGPSPLAPGLHRDRLGEHLRPQPVPPAVAPRTSPAFAPNFTIIDVPSFKADPATEGTRTGTAILRPPPADGDHHRRHRVRRRDQEVAPSRS